LSGEGLEVGKPSLRSIFHKKVTKREKYRGKKPNENTSQKWDKNSEKPFFSRNQFFLQLFQESVQ
jgi:hypothetical protein